MKSKAFFCGIEVLNVVKSVTFSNWFRISFALSKGVLKQRDVPLGVGSAVGLLVFITGVSVGAWVMRFSELRDVGGAVFKADTGLFVGLFTSLEGAEVGKLVGERLGGSGLSLSEKQDVQHVFLQLTSGGSGGLAQSASS